MLERLLKAFNLKSRRVNGESTDLKIDAELLACPICFDIFADAPLVLPCGHSICGSCLSRLMKGNTGRDSTFQCAICRKAFSKNRQFPKNYTVESILSSVDEWTDSEMSNEISANNAGRITIARLKKKVEVVLADNSELKLEVSKLKRSRVLQIVLGCIFTACGVLISRFLQSL